MKCFLIFAIVLGVVCSQILANSKTDPSPTQTTTTTYILGKVCGPIGVLAADVVGKATADGVRKYEETNDITLAAKVAAERGIASASGLFKSATKAAGIGADLAKEIQNGGNPKAVLAQRTQAAVNYLKEEFKRDPHGKVAKALITGGNVALTWTAGPLVGWSSAVLASAAADGLASFNESGNISQATQVAVKSGYDSAANLMKSVCGIVSSGAGLAKDIYEGKETKHALKQRGGQALNSIRSGKK
ncbi:uncharacterized protein LOC116339645 [Contarinia nasturtii]|uniref:uncharacterized protein LOC116339645 n=1 Tax=Contarinia nasturtii TaxID=265458 RepID=UPI0012D44EAD|nr:uncharacterized protein LOC116339645 [Contarinia nasturtii]